MRALLLTLAALCALTLPVSSFAQPACTLAPDGLVSWWPGDGNSNDIGNGSNHGSLVGDVMFLPGFVGDAFSIGGTRDDYVQVPTNSTLQPAQLTLSTWVRANGSPGPFSYIAAKGAEACEAASYALYTGANGGLQFYIFDGSQFAVSPDAGAIVWDDQWDHIAGSYDGTTVRLYVDGMEVGSGTPASLAIAYNLSTNNDLVIGSYLDQGSCGGAPDEFGFPGEVDEFSLFNIALAQTDIEDIFDAQQAGMCKQLSIDIDVVPGSDDNAIEISAASNIPVALLSSTEFDATQIDPLSVELSAADIKLVTDTTVPVICEAQDVNNDELIDLLCNVPTVDFIIEQGEAVAQLTAETFTGQQVTGQDFVRIIMDPIITFVDQDSWLKRAARHDNFGGDQELVVKRKPYDHERAVMRFDLSDIPLGADVQSATVTLRVTTADNRRVRVFQVTDSWTEYGVTWHNTASDRGETRVAAFQPSQDDAFVTFDLTDLVQQWACGTPNNGIMLIAKSLDRQSKYYSRDIDIPEYRPRMNVEFGGNTMPCAAAD